MHRYNPDEYPPAPFLNIVIRHPDNPTQAFPVRAKLDTGADISALPATLIEQLGLPVFSKLLVEGYDGISTTVTTYGTIIVIGAARFKSQEVITIPEEHALLGRDLLNYFYIQLNGPDLTFDLSLTPF